MKNLRYLNKDKISKIPPNCGVYIFKGGEKILYIGKAANIRERIKNHFQQPTYRDKLFLDKINKIGYLLTDSEIEALILEAKLIKKYQPKYNIAWRDDKNYFFVGVTKENFPRVFISHQPKLEREKSKLEINYVGPFVDGRALKQALKILRKIFPYRSCYKIPNRTCLWYHLDRCLAPCLLKSNLVKEIPLDSLKIKKISQRNAKNLIKILKKGKSSVLKELKKEMEAASKNQDFEEAAQIRDQIEALEKIFAHIKIFDQEVIKSESKISLYKQVEKDLRKTLKIKNKILRIEAYDISNIQGKEAAGSMVTFINGEPNKSFYRHFRVKISGKPNDTAMLKECLQRRFKHPEWPYPDLILIDGGKGQLKAAQLTINNQQLTIPVIALAKKHNQLFTENQKDPIPLDILPKETKFLILQLRDEAHRFAITYHKKLRKLAFLPKL